MRIIFIGCVRTSAEFLKTIINFNFKIEAVISTKNSTFNSDYFDLEPICKVSNLPFFNIDDMGSESLIHLIKQIKPNIIFCLGWSKLLPKEILDIPQYGTIGFHPAALPKNRGRHPIIWSLVLGLKKTASTFFFMELTADSGPIISQKEIDITDLDNAQTLYEKILKVSKLQLLEILEHLKLKDLKSFPQNNLIANSWRKRTHKDGLIDWRMSAKSIKNLVRGLSKPYPGASFFLNGIEHKVWSVEIYPFEAANTEPGKIIDIEDNKYIVKCSDVAIKITEIDPPINLSIGEYI